MKRWMVGLLALFVLAAMPVGADAQTGARFWVQVRGDNGLPITDATLCRVRTAGARTEPSIYTSGTLGTAATNPLTANTTTGEVEWYMEGTTASVDLDCYVVTGDYRGSKGTLSSLTRSSTHVMSIPKAMGHKIFVVPTTTTATSVLQTAAAVLPAGSIVTDAFVEIVTAVGSASTISFGMGVNTIQFCNAVASDVVVFVNCNPADILVTTATALTYTNQAHATKAYGFIYAMTP